MIISNNIVGLGTGDEAGNGELLTEFKELWDEVDQLWEQEQATEPFGGYVSSDFLSVYQELLRLRDSNPKISKVLEWGSGLGVIAIMASRMGFDAYGIEAEPVLVEHSVRLAEKFASNAQFAAGSFVPDGFQWKPAVGTELNQTKIDVPDAYGGLQMGLEDFDLVLAYPWPEERRPFASIMREFGRPNAMLLIYDAREGITVSRPFER